MSRFPKRVFVAGCVALAGVFSMAAVAGDPDPDRYIVSFQDDAKGKAALMAAGARIELNLPSQGAAAAHIPARALNGLRRNPNIEFIEKDALRFPMGQTTPWGIPAVQADLASEGGSAVNVCIIDSGYANGHEDLPDLSGGTHGTGTPLEDNSCFHGTHVAGTVAAVSNTVGVVGVVPGKTQLSIVKVFDGEDCAWTYSSDLVAALDECKLAGADIVSMSLGGPAKSRAEDRAFGEANNNGVLSIAAAGNDGNPSKSYPASYDSVVSVAAVDSALELADFSQRNNQVELSAPGVAVRSTVLEGSGTEESLTAGSDTYEAVGMEDSAQGTGSGVLTRCEAVDGLGSPGDCANLSGGEVCLIQRGDISFAEKVVECESQGGNGVVIYNNADALFSGTLGGETTGIPSVGVSGNDGADLIANHLGGSATVTVEAGNYAFYDGTSMATPHVSGVAALVWSQGASCTNHEVRTALTSTARDLGDAGRDNSFGYGLVQAADAIASLTCSGSGGVCTLEPKGASCDADADCCSNKCKGGGPSGKSCK